MIPTSSSSSTNGCDSISSNCVIWQGPDISCIDLCNGDTISDVTAKLAVLVCDLITNGVASNPSLTGLNLSCLNIPGTTPTTLVPVLQEMVNAICADNTPSTERPGILPIMTLPACLVYNDSLGNPVTQLRLDLFATLIATKVCDILTSIVFINTTLTNYNTRLNVLEACVLPCSGTVAEKQVVPTCIIRVGQLTDVSVLLLALEVRYCALETAVGLPAAINATISQGACILSTTPTLANSAVSYGSIPGWKNTPINLAQTTQNIWAVLCDLYTAVSDIQTNCCPSGCDLVSFGYNISNILASNGTISGLNFNFQNTTGDGSVIPATFNDCAGSTIITIRDVNNVAVTSTVSVAALQNSAGGVTISLPGLNTYGALTTSVAFCVTNGRDTCNDTISKPVAGIIPCPTPAMSAISTTGATVTFTNNLGATPVYIIDILNNTTNVVVATYTQNSPGATVTNAFTGLVAGTEYKTRVTVQVGGQTQVCTNTVTFSTSAAVTVPTITTAPVTNNTPTSAVSGGTSINANGGTVSTRGVQWSTSSTFATITGSTSNGTGTSNFTSAMSPLTPNTTYYVRAYATNEAGTGYGTAISFVSEQTVVLNPFDYIIVTYQYSPPPGADYDLDTLTTFRYPSSTITGTNGAALSGFIDLTGVVGWCTGKSNRNAVIPTNLPNGTPANINTAYLTFGGDDVGQTVDGAYGESVVINFKNLEDSGILNLGENIVIAELYAGWQSGTTQYPINIKYETYIGGTVSNYFLPPPPPGGTTTNRYISDGTPGNASATSNPINIIEGTGCAGVQTSAEGIKRSVASITYNRTTGAASISFPSYPLIP